MAFGSQSCTPVSDLEANLLFFYILGRSPDIVLARTMQKFSAAATKSIGVLHRPKRMPRRSFRNRAETRSLCNPDGPGLPSTPLHDDSLRIIRVKGLTRVTLWTLDRGVILRTDRSLVFALH